jgi:HTH-type transcriptional regulator, transcriptional repressor of NAD biosynthesis genes
MTSWTQSEHPAETGLVVGRFDPPHLGHSYLIETAAASCEHLVVFVSSGPRDAVPGHMRAAWLAELHPVARVIEVRHDLRTDFSDESLWERWMTLFRGHWPLATGPQIVVSSDPYIDELAKRFGAEPRVVDAERVTVPISATMIRQDPARHLDRLAPPVRAWVQASWVERAPTRDESPDH